MDRVSIGILKSNGEVWVNKEDLIVLLKLYVNSGIDLRKLITLIEADFSEETFKMILELRK